MKKNLYNYPQAISLKFACLLVLILHVLVCNNLHAQNNTHKIAALASQATVGVYAQKSGDKFYGTGVTVSPHGYIITSTTVVPQGSKKVEVYFSNHNKEPAKIIEINNATETVLLKVNSSKLPFLPLSKQLPELGESAYTMGNSGNMIKLGDGASFSAGVVSGIYELKSADNQSGYQGLAIETDAAVNPGTDGGPLINNQGQIIGIISRGFSTLRWQGVAIPMAKIINNLKSLPKGKISFKPLLDNNHQQLTWLNNYKQAIVGIEVIREFKPELINRPEWTEYRKSIKQWGKLSPVKQKRIMADFFAAESLLAANQMLRRPHGLTTGVLVSPNGFILTSSFNVQSSDMVYLRKGSSQPKLPRYDGNVRNLYKLKANKYTRQSNRVLEIKIHLADGSAVPAEIAGFNTALDVALLKIDLDQQLPFLNLNNLKNLPNTGEDIFILGYSRGQTPLTLNSGVVSTAKRNNNKMFQFDALLNYGNSGGPVVSINGKLLGFASTPLRPSPIMGKILPFKMPADDPGARALNDFPNTPNSGIGLAVLTENIIQAVKLMKQGAQIKRGAGVYTGLYPTKNSAFSKRVIIGSIQNVSPAKKAGLKINDQVVKADGINIRSWKEFKDYLKEKKPGDTLILDIFRPLSKPYILLNGQKLNSATQLELFIRNNPDNTKVSGKVIHPGIKQKVFLTLEREK